ncbi:MAG TPA: DUF6457 domain-containing protein [Pseudonocardiaceae bacterium]
MADQKDDPEKMARMRAWLAAVSAELGVEDEVLSRVEAPLLDLIAQVAHGPSRPGAPLTAFLVGVAAGRGGDANGPVTKISKLADRYAA